MQSIIRSLFTILNGKQILMLTACGVFCVRVCVYVCRAYACVWYGAVYFISGAYEAQHLTVKLAQTAFELFSVQSAVLDDHHFFSYYLYINLLNDDINRSIANSC